MTFYNSAQPVHLHFRLRNVSSRLLFWLLGEKAAQNGCRKDGGVKQMEAMSAQGHAVNNRHLVLTELRDQVV